MVENVTRVSGTQIDADGDALHEAVGHQRAGVDIEVDAHQPEAGDHLQAEAADHADARVHAADEDGEEEAERGADAARGDDLADQRVGKAGMLLQQRRQQHHRREIQHAVDQHQHQAEGVVAI